MKPTNEQYENMNLLVLNSGSGSHKCSLFSMGKVLPAEPLEPVWKAVIMATRPRKHRARTLINY